jgi:predicted transcriptional regulator
MSYDVDMRTTLTLDDDVADRTRALAHKLRKPFKAVVNEALRLRKNKGQVLKYHFVMNLILLSRLQ